MRNLLDKFAPLRGAPQKPEVAHASGADLAPVVALLTRSLHLSGQIAARNLPRNAPIGKLCDVEFRVSSQWGEDGISSGSSITSRSAARNSWNSGWRISARPIAAF